MGWIKFAEDNLSKGETILYQTYTHWITIIAPSFWLCAYAAGFVITPDIDLIALSENPTNYILDNFGFGLISLFAAIGMLYSAAILVRRLLLLFTTEITITDRRVIWKTGLFWRSTGEISRRVIEGNNLEQSVLGRLLRYGTIMVNGIGNQTLTLTNIHCPLDFRKHLNRLRTKGKAAPDRRKRGQSPNRTQSTTKGEPPFPKR